VFEESVLNDEVSNQLNHRTKLVSKRSVSDDRPEELGWFGRAKRSWSNYWSDKSDDKEATPTSEKLKKVNATKKKTKMTTTTTTTEPTTAYSSARRRRQDDDEDSDDEDNEIGSGSGLDVESTSDPIAPLPSVNDDKYCE